MNSKEELCDIDHAGRFIHNDEAAGAHHGADGDEAVIIDRCIDEGRRDAAAGRTAGLCSLELVAAGMPPPISSTTSRRVVPIGTLNKAVLLILPPSANTLVPALFSVPMLRNHCGPLRKICGMLAYVSTLFRTVGFWNRPLSAGNGGRHSARRAYLRWRS